MEDQSGSILYQYDEYNRLASVTDARGITLSYTYDKAGRLQTLDNGFGKTSYEYDLLDRVTRVIDHNGQATVYEYDALGNRSAVRYPNGSVMTYTYDTCQRLKEEWVTNADGETLAKYTYGIGRAGERTSIIELNGGVETETTYQYDKLKRLVKETIERDGNRLINEYTYDKVSNRIQKETTVKGELSALADIDSEDIQVTEGTTAYTYNELNQLVSEQSEEGTIVYTYDDNGNLIRQSGDRSVDYRYDRENHLLRATVQKRNSVTVESYTYDYAGNRTSKTVNEGNTTYYVTDTSGSLSYVVAETNEAGEAAAFYTRGEELISMEKEGRTWYYLYDGHGSVRTLTNAEGRVTDRYSYDAYGNLLEKEGGTENEFLYTGEQYNANTGLYYLRARYMNPSTGTFISMDSYQGSIYDPVSLHKYLYANANPVMYTDPSGYNSVAEAEVYMGGTSSLAAAEAYYNSVMFKIGMKLLSQARALKAVEAVSYFATTVLLSLAVEDALNEGKFTDAYDVAVEILQYTLDHIELICDEAGIAGETVAERIKTAIYEAENKGKKGKKGGQSSDKEGENSKENEYKQPVSGKSGKETADDVPSWAKGERPYKNENGRQFAKRLLDKMYGEGNYKAESQTEFSRIQKWGDRGFK